MGMGTKKLKVFSGLGWSGIPTSMSALSRGLLRTEASMAGWPSSVEVEVGGGGRGALELLASCAPAHDFSSRQERKREGQRGCPRFDKEGEVVGPTI